MATLTTYVAFSLSPSHVPATNGGRWAARQVGASRAKAGGASPLVLSFPGARPVTKARRFWCKASTEGAAPSSGQGVATLHPPSDAGEAGSEADVVVVGAGLAGLAAAREVHRAGLSFLLLDASDGVGGRVRSDQVEGFMLDRGFQIFLSAYPTAREMLDYEALDLRPFYAGANVWFGGAFHRVADPFRHPLDGVLSLPNPVGSILDKINVGLFRFKCVAKPLDAIWSAPEVTIGEKLRKEGFSDQIVDRFFRPFLGGIFFDRDLGTTSRLLEFVLRMLALGANTLPAGGIEAIPRQLAASLPSSSIRLNSEVDQIVPGGNDGPKATVQLADGKSIRAKLGVVVAVEGPEGKRLLEGPLSRSPSKDAPPRSTVCLYFGAPKAPSALPILFLNGTPRGIVNNMCFPSAVVPEYAPKGQALVSVSLIGNHTDSSDEQLEMQVRDELKEWFGASEVDTWRHLRTYRIPYAQPDQRPPTNLRRDVRLGEGLYVCGDHREASTFDGALASGRRAAKSLLEEVQRVGAK